MQFKHPRVCRSLFALFGIFFLARGAFGAGVFLKLPDASQGEWRLLGGNPEMQHHSSLKKINVDNVKDLGLAWYADVPTPDGLAGNPLVADGVIYQSGALGKVWAHDLRSGKQLWEFDAQIKFDTSGTVISFWGSRVNRGLALLDDRVFIGTGDCRLIAIDRKTGIKAWETQACDAAAYYSITGAPRVGNGKVFIGNANADSGATRGYVAAFDARSGRELWRFYIVPGDPAKGFENKAMEMASKTWGQEYWKVSAGGGSPWDAMTFDPVLNQIYVGTDGPSPFNPKDRAQKGRGDELFTNSIVALDADTGAYRWHYQTTPNDAWNLAAAMHIMIAELPIKGTTRRVVMQAPKNGFFYVLDAKSGKFISANNFVYVNWASHINSRTGRPVELPDARYYDLKAKRAVVAPSPLGARAWQAMSYNPATGLVYFTALDTPTPMEITGGTGGLVGGSLHIDWLAPLSDKSRVGRLGKLIAWDPLKQKPKWSVNLERPMNGGVLSTAGELVFLGTATGEIKAYHARTGEVLWSYKSGSATQAAPTTVEVDGEQMLLVPVGPSGAMLKYTPEFNYTEQALGPARLLAFKLGTRTALPPSQFVEVFPKPPRLRPESVPDIKKGRALFEARGCEMCHGADAKLTLGSIPDLRKSSAASHDNFAAIVKDGMLLGRGMPAYNDTVTPEELDLLQKFVLHQAWDAYERQEKHKPIN